MVSTTRVRYLDIVCVPEYGLSLLVVFFFFFFFVVVFCFQAEDGIRDLVRSRGLGDVYKRQGVFIVDRLGDFLAADLRRIRPGAIPPVAQRQIAHSLRAWHPARCPQFAPVSYTHLTLPTSDLV